MTAASPPGPSDRSPRHFATVLFTDIVGSTELQTELGDVEWQVLLGHHNDLVRAAIDRHGGREISTAGDSFLAVFETPEEAIACALEAAEAVRQEGLEIRSGIHTGEIVETEHDVGGIAVNIGARVSSMAGPGEVLVSQTVHDLVQGSGIQLEPRGTHQLKGVMGQWRIYAIEGTAHRAGIVREARVWLDRHRVQAVSAIVALAIVVGLAGLYGVIRDRGQGDSATSMQGSSDSSTAPDLSIAVLPFANLSADPENEYFSDGITEEILTTLAKIGDLKVTSRTSVMQYKGHTGNLQEIAQALGVSTILEGSVRRSGDRVRITAQLIQASTDEHLWAETYDRELTDIFEIQASVATNIVSALNVAMTAREREQVERTITQSPDAYDLYLQAKGHLNRFAPDLEHAEKLYLRAVEIDPGFALAFAELSTVHSRLYWGWEDRTEERLEKAREAVEEALRIDPDQPEARLAMGYYHYYGFRDYDRAIEEFVQARQDLPNDAEVIAAIGYIRRRQGLWDEALAALEAAAALDPVNYTILRNLANTYGMMRDFSRALEVLDRAQLLDPDWAPLDKGWYQFARTGDSDLYRSALEGLSPDYDPGGCTTYVRYLLAMLEHDYAQAEQILSTFQGEYVCRGQPPNHKLVLLGDVSRARNQLAEARERYAAAREALETAVQNLPDDPHIRTELGWAYANLGLRDEAIEQGRLAVELVPQTLDAMASVVYAHGLAAIYAQVGETELALAEIERLLSIPSWVTRSQLRLDPTWDPLRDDPRFQELVREDS